MEKEKLIWIVKEPIWKSIIKDTYTFGYLFGLFFLNNKLIDGGKTVDIIVFIMLLILIVGKSQREYVSIEEAKKRLEKFEGKNNND